MTLHPGVEYCREVTKEEHLTLACLDCRPKMTQGRYCHCKVYYILFISCTLF
ncbi:hypothetical protein HOLleu_01170 [Holothuria leucospilota]|uniref:Uncharacterized protein n=1 Tax=Holothuria leucospilota TaxID=206669 RepID=A0A9Q1CP03_HOLLE|nr:hypothetical protein HOLleu_01170 [Holothuria leucospilota]